MPEYVAADFWSEVDKYYEAKKPYTELLQSAATRKPLEEDKAKQQRPIPSILDEINGWPHQQVSNHQTGPSTDPGNETISEDMQDLKVEDVNGKQETTTKQDFKS